MRCVWHKIENFCIWNTKSHTVFPTEPEKFANEVGEHE